MKKALLFSLVFVLLLAAAAAVASEFKQVAEFEIPEANQGIGVDENYFYAIDNQIIAKYDKRTGKPEAKWQGPKDGPIIHLDSAAVIDGKIYCAHSNWPEWPMTSSIEIWDAKTMEHIGSRSFGIHWGSATWIDLHDGCWWVTFANYERPYGPNKSPYGYKAATTLVKFTADWQWVEAWVLPKAILERLEDMSNSGGSWGPDGYLYLSGHDPAEVYKCKLPEAGSVLELVEIIPMNIRGQGIAWDRSEPGVLYGIVRATKQEKEAGKTHKVTVSKLQ
jgi:hypothetical protein